MNTSLTTAEKADTVSLDQYRQKKYNVLVPTASMQQISPFHRIRIEEVNIDPNPDAGDVFKVGSKNVGGNWEDVLSLSKTALMKISNAAGIVWNWSETKVITCNRDYVLYQAVGAFKKPSGEWLPLKNSKEIDLTVIEEETYEANLEKARKLANSGNQKDIQKLNGMTAEQYAAAQTKSAMIQWRKNKLMRAETGAMLRVIRDLLSIKQQYSPAELQKPFIVPHVDFSPDYSDPAVRKMVMENGIQATANLFGTTSPQQLPGQTMQHIEDSNVFNIDPDEDMSGTYEGTAHVQNADIVEDLEEDPVPEQVIMDAVPSNEPPTCEYEGCTKKLSHAEADYSIVHYEHLYCFKHQKLAKKVSQ